MKVAVILKEWKIERDNNTLPAHSSDIEVCSPREVLETIKEYHECFKDATPIEGGWLIEDGNIGEWNWHYTARTGIRYEIRVLVRITTI